MRLLGQILLACLIICVLQGILAVLAIAVVLGIIWGLLFRTAETAGCIALLLYLRALELWPLATVGMTLASIGIVLIARAQRTAKSSPMERRLLPSSRSDADADQP